MVNENHHESPSALRKNPRLWAAVSISQTLLTSIMFGWASLVPVIQDEAIGSGDYATGIGGGYTPSQLSQIFTAGAVGNYLATLPFGWLLDVCGPKITSAIASLMYGLGILLCGIHDSDIFLFWVGFGLVGASRPGIQLPTMHLANLFDKDDGAARKSTRPRLGGAGLYMSAQAAAFDAGTAIFALFHSFHFRFGWSSSVMFRWYLLVPFYCLVTAIWIWPNKAIDKPQRPAQELSEQVLPKDEKEVASQESQVNASLSVILSKPAFYALACWVGIHIFQLNFVIATINSQLQRWYTLGDASTLITILGSMLPFGFVVLPFVAYMLDTDTTLALQTANFVAFTYGAILVFFPGNYWLQVLIVFPAIAGSRQLVYSTLFHTIGQTFGYSNYGVIFGLINAIASSFQCLQTPMVRWSEHSEISHNCNQTTNQTGLSQSGVTTLSAPSSYSDYGPSNFMLWIATFPLFVTVMYCDPVRGGNRCMLGVRRMFRRQFRNVWNTQNVFVTSETLDERTSLLERQP